MTKAVAVLLVGLFAKGHWLGGRKNEVTFQWAAVEKMPKSVVVWRLKFGKVRLAGGRLALAGGKNPARLELTLPKVRVRTSMELEYRVLSSDGQRELLAGKETIRVYPDDLLASCAKPFRDKRLIVWDVPRGLPKALKAAGIPHRRVADGSALQMASADLILVGQDQIGASAFDQAELLDHVRSGASVFIFSQSRPPTLMGYPLVKKRGPKRMEWKANHGLFAAMDKELLTGLLPGSDTNVLALGLQAGDASRRLAWWPRDASGGRPAPGNALVLTNAAGKGRLGLCQIPLGPWDRDPRSQILLANVLEYYLAGGERRARDSSDSSSDQSSNKEIRHEASDTGRIADEPVGTGLVRNGR